MGHVPGLPVSGGDLLDGLRRYLGTSAEQLSRIPGGLAYMARELASDPVLFLQRAGPGLAGLGMSIPFFRAPRLGSRAKPSGLGDLTISEVNEIQAIVNQAGRPLEVVGSAARGMRKTGSDIDYLVPPGSLPYFRGLEGRLPGLDPKHGIAPGVGNPKIGPVIRFEPK